MLQLPDPLQVLTYQTRIHERALSHKPQIQRSGKKEIKERRKKGLYARKSLTGLPHPSLLPDTENSLNDFLKHN